MNVASIEIREYERDRDIGLGSLLEVLYDAAESLGSWTPFLTLFARRAAVNGMVLFTRCDPGDGVELHGAVGLDAIGRDAVRRLPPLAARFRDMAPGSVMDLRELEDCDALAALTGVRSSPFDAVGLVAREDTHVTLWLVRTGTNAREAFVAALRMLRQLTPHVGRAMRIRRRLADLHRTRRAAENAFARLGLGSVTLDGDQRVLHADRRARALLDRGDVLRIDPTGRLTAHGPDQTRLAQRVVAATTAHDACPTDPGGTLVLHSRDGKHSVRMFVCATTDATPSHRPAALAFVSGAPAAPPPQGASALAAVLGVTHAQARVLDALLAGVSVKAYAAAHAVSVDTVRTHVRNLLNKTGHTRQQDLLVSVASDVIARLARAGADGADGVVAPHPGSAPLG